MHKEGMVKSYKELTKLPPYVGILRWYIREKLKEYA